MRQYSVSHKGQLLVEVLIAIGIAASLIGGAISLYVVSLRTNMNARLSAIGIQLAQETYNNVKSLAEADWHTVYSITKGTNQRLNLAGGVFSIAPGSETIEVDGTQYTRSFIIENVRRGAGGDIIPSGGTNDHSTQRVVVTVSWPILGGVNNTTISGHITRSRNISLLSTAWTDGPGSAGPFVGQVSGFFSSSNIDHTTLPGTIRILSF